MLFFNELNMKKQNWDIIEKFLKEKYPNLNIEIDKESYIGSRKKMRIVVNGEDFWVLYQNLRDGRIKFKRFNSEWKNPQKHSFDEIEKKILKATIKKFPEVTNFLDIKVLNYTNANEKMTIEYNGKTKTQIASILLAHGLTSNDLGLKRKAHFKHDPIDVLKKIKEKYPYVSFKISDYIDFKTRILFTDDIYGEWNAIPYEVLKGRQHPQRAIEKRRKFQSIDVSEVIQRINNGYDNGKEVIPPRDYLLVDINSYVDTRTPCKFIDKEYGEFMAIPNHVIFGQEHPKRSKKGSKYELEILLWLESLGFKVEKNVKFSYDGKSKEIDVFIVDKNIGIEINGLYWHNEGKKNKKYHLEKREMMNSLGIKLVQITDEEWVSKKDIVKGLILSNIGMISQKIMARKCKVKKITRNEAQVFLDDNHLMGFTQASFMALFYNDEIVSVLSYHHKKDGKEIDISRFCNKKDVVVVGGLSKLINAIPKKEAKRIVSWVDLRYGDGHSLKTIGFTLERIVLSFRWTDNSRTFNRRYCRANMDYRKLSEQAYANEMKLFKIYDAGQALFLKNI